MVPGDVRKSRTGRSHQGGRKEKRGDKGDHGDASRSLSKRSQT
jgi:hypothetical protein